MLDNVGSRRGLTLGYRGDEYRACDAMNHIEPLVPVMIIFVVVYYGNGQSEKKGSGDLVGEERVSE